MKDKEKITIDIKRYIILLININITKNNNESDVNNLFFNSLVN